MTQATERDYLIYIINVALNLNIENCKFMKRLYKDQKARKTFNKSIRQCEKARLLIKEIKHLEILRAIYGDIVGQISGQLMLGGTLICSKQLKKWDISEKGFKEFQDLQEENKKIYQEKIKRQQEQRIAIEKAKEQGKKVEMFYDPTTKSVKPVVVESDNKA